jgi:SulP family sulfate permease
MKVSAQATTQRKPLGADLTAGVTTAFVTIPDGLASAILAGVNPLNGLYALMVGTPVAALLASSQFMYVANTGAIAITVNSVLQGVSSDQIASALVVLTILAGLIQLTLGLLKAGGLMRYISNAVLVGFMTGVALNIILGQLGDFTGFQSSYSNKVAQTIDLLLNLDEIDPQTTAIGVATLILILSFHRIKRLSNFSMILALAGGSLLTLALGWTSVEVIGDIAQIPSGFPRPVLPDLSLVPALLPGALAVAIIGLVQASGISKSVPNPDGNYPDASRDFVAQGAGNIAGGFFQGMPVGGTMSETSVNIKAGARTRRALIFSAIVIIIAVMLFDNLVEYLALPAIAALLIVAGYDAIKVDSIRDVWNTSRAPRGIMLFTFAMTLVLPVQWAVLLGVLLAMGQFIYQSSTDVRMVELVPQADGTFVERPAPMQLSPNMIVVLQPYGSLHFAGAHVLEDQLPSPQGASGATVILRLRDLDQSGSTLVSVLERYAKNLHSNGGHLVLTELNERVYMQLVKTETLELIGVDRAYRAEADFLGATIKAISDARELQMTTSSAKPPDQPALHAAGATE